MVSVAQGSAMTNRPPSDTDAPEKSGGRSFVRDLGLLMAGSGGAQLIVVLTAPLLSRIYSPEMFAALALLTSTFAIISRFSSLKYETAVATGRTKPEMGTLAALATGALMIVSLLTALGSLLFFPVIEGKIGTASAWAFCVALPIIVLLDGLIQIIITWSVRWKEFSTVSSNDLIRNGSSALTQAGVGLAGFVNGGLLFGQVVGSAIAFAVLMPRRSARELYRLMRQGSWRRRRVVAQRFVDFPLYQMPKAILNAMGRNMPTVLIAAYFSAASTGFFFFALRLTALPAQLLSQSLGRVLLQRFANLWTRKHISITPLLIKSTLGFFLLAAPLVVIISLFGPEIFRIFLGKQWEAAGHIAAWTILWSAATICGTPAQMAMTVLRQNRTMLLLEGLFLPLRLLPFPLLAASGDVNLAVALCCGAAALFNTTMIATAIATSVRLSRKHGMRAPAAKG